MTVTVEAIYEHGYLRLMEPIGLEDGTRVEVAITAAESDRGGQTPAAILAAIAQIPLEANDDAFSGRDHDEALYGDKGAR